MMELEIKEAESRFEEIVSLLESRKITEVIVTRNGNPVARIVPYCN